MAKFKLTPMSDCLDDRSWAYSTWQQPCYVGADSEAEARDFASRQFVQAAEVVDRQKIPSGMPWLDPDLTSCTEILEIAGDPMPRGYVYVVDDSGCAERQRGVV